MAAWAEAGKMERELRSVSGETGEDGKGPDPIDLHMGDLHMGDLHMGDLHMGDLHMGKRIRAGRTEVQKSQGWLGRN
jgi:hypothetical protein